MILGWRVRAPRQPHAHNFTIPLSIATRKTLQ